MDRWAAERPEAPALWWVNDAGDKEAKYSFRQLKDLGRKAANYLRGQGIGKGDRVMILLPRLPEWWIVMLGLVRMGAVPIPSTLLSTERDLAYRMQMGRIKGVVTTTDGALKLSKFQGLRFLVGGSMPDWQDFDAGVRGASTEFEGESTRGEDPGIIFFTSATTGEPKMVLHTQTSYGLGHRQTGELWLDLHPDDLHWNLSDLGWGKAAWSSFYGPWHMGACVFAVDIRGKYDPHHTLEILSRYPITSWCAPPTALRLIVRQDLSRWKFPRLRHCVSAGEPLNPEVITIWKAATGLTIYEAYGQTETVMLIGNFRSTGFPVRPGSMGRGNPNFQIALLDDQLQEVADGVEGEIAIRTKPERPIGLFREYLNFEAENKRQFKEGWYLTGDRARRDADGYYWFVGRADDVIKSSGYRIGPFEVEHALMEHKAVLDVAVVGKPDEIRGQIVKAFVVLRPSYQPSVTLKAELQMYCKKTVAPYKYPRDIEFVKELPKTTSGKTRRVELRQREATARKAKVLKSVSRV
jgi:acetyl-CoA synthetase/medium-chain acyl-CoA synthetase